MAVIQCARIVVNDDGKDNDDDDDDDNNDNDPVLHLFLSATSIPCLEVQYR